MYESGYGGPISTENDGQADTGRAFFKKDNKKN